MKLLLDEGQAMRSFVGVVLVILVTGGDICVSAPQPAAAPKPEHWTVDMRFEHPKQIMWAGGAGRDAKCFWYMIATITNNTKGDVEFYPKCDLMTDTFEVIPAGRAVAVEIFEQIKKRHGRRYPFLEYWEKTSSRILQGEDNAKDIAIVWPDFDAKAKQVKLFIAGLSNETVVIEHPTAKDENGEPVKVYLRKTLELEYGVGGDADVRSKTKLTYKGKSWVMR